MIKENLLYGLLGIAVLIFTGCGKDDAMRFLRPGYLSTRIAAGNNDTAKDLVSCGGTPLYAVYSLLNEFGMYKDTFDIQVSDKIAVFEGQMTFPEGTYTVEDVSLYDQDWNLTHTAPDGSEEIDFSAFVDTYLPYEVTIVPYEIVYVNDQVLCFTNARVEPDPIGSGELSIIETESMYFYIFPQSCIDRVVLEVDGKVFGQTERPFDGLHMLAVPTEFQYFSLSAYVSDNIVQSFAGPYHSADNIYYFGLNCD